MILLLTAWFLMLAPATGLVMPDNRDVNLLVANDAGARYNDNGNGTYNFFNQGQTSSQGLNQLKLTTNAADPTSGQVVFNGNRTGTFYVADTGGRGWNDDIVLMLAVNGTVPDDFRLRIKARGYQWAPVLTGSYPAPGDLTYNATALDETFTKDDLVYGPQTWKPCAGENTRYPIFEGQNMADASNTFSIMMIDLNVGDLGSGTRNQAAYSGISLTDSGLVRVDYTLENLNAFAAFGAYAYCTSSNQGRGIRWTNNVNTLGGTAATSGYYVTTPGVVQVPPGTAVPIDTDGDGLYNDVNGNGRKDFADVVLYFNQMTWIAANEPVAAFDCNGNGRIDFGDVVWLFNHL